MSKFENPNVTIEKTVDKEITAKVNLADASRDEMYLLNKMLHCDGKNAYLPLCEIGVDPTTRPGQKLINALERRGFDVDVDKENGTVEISRPIKFGDGHRLPGDPVRRAEVVWDREQGVHVEIGKPLGHDHKYSLAERAAWRIARNVYDK